MSTPVLIILIAGLLAQLPAPKPAASAAAEDRAADSASAAAARLAIMKRSLMIFDVHSISDRATTFRLQPEPIFRFTNPVGNSIDGAVFFWLGENNRPEMAVQVLLNRNDGRWAQEFISFSPAPLIAEPNDAAVAAWTPARGGVELKPVPGAPRPAETAEQRLRQMRALIKDFAALDNFQGQSWQRLRLLTKPLARYGKPGTNLLDGALFGFVLGTDPEACVMLEARTGTDAPEWQYAFAPMSTYALQGSWKGLEVWSLPWRKPGDKGPDQTFHNRNFQPGE